MAVPMRMAVATVTCECGGRVASSAIVMWPPGFLIDRRRISERRARRGYQNISTPFGAHLTCVVFATEQALRLLLPIDGAPALRSNSSIYVFAGRGGFKQLAIVAALLPLRSVLILHDLLRYLGSLRGRRCADDHCRSCDRCPGGAGRDGQNLSPGNSLWFC